ncbi:MAG: pyridine nucleotide-disulfide oxidoreductase [Paraburkholderia sp.]|uniref:FAD-dependent oxidoreductase n=1 Tax=Paraburkholderia sp. TaxID=1926495 RepID=UPI0012052488|nr:FAD-dependent oxidoreductase [Paraburkholderia sp.]TAM01278.1 MAG: pyridine nucleotide-disulfide oxidoreductase [Paraburkholderia sp.]TAM31516.1 MAG: pyridine nucleotide-disulfide oxidoreductase [Paraburkholderia sp.]
MSSETGSENGSENGPDLAQGVSLESFGTTGVLAGHVGDDAVMIARVGDEFLAVDAACTHYHGPLSEGLIVGDTVRCPWHHACFNLRTGEAVRAPALSPVACWSTAIRGDKVFVLHKLAPAASSVSVPAGAPQKIVIVGAGAAGFAAAERLRRLGYAGSLTMLSDDDAAPVDRPNLSKDYLAGSAPEDWVWLRDDAFYADQRIDLRLKANAVRLDVAAQEVELADGSRVPYDRLLLATGAEAIRLPIPGMDLPHVYTLRSLADSRAIIARAASARRVVVIGASFIGLEVAASLRTRGLEVHVVAPERRPMERVLGPEMGDFVRQLHEEHGVVFHLENTVDAIDAQRVSLKAGGSVEADLVVAGVGVRPRLTLAEQAGLAINRGVVVDACLQTSVPGIFAAGDIARWPDPHSGADIRVEHWVVAQRQGQTAAMNLIGGHEKFDSVPFFWSQHYDVPINYVGHAESWDELSVEGSIAARDCVLRYKRAGRVIAVASIYRDVDSLRAEVEMERGSS